MTQEISPEQIEAIFKIIEAESRRRGYKFERHPDGSVRLIRPDGSVAMIGSRNGIPDIRNPEFKK